MSAANLKAWCYASGLIRFGKRVPAGALMIAAGPHRKLHAAIEAIARHGQGKSTGRLLVPGIPEAPNQDKGIDALRRFIAEVARGFPEATLPKGVDLEEIRARMVNPFVRRVSGGDIAQAVDVESRLDDVKEFDEYECAAALNMKGLQATVRKAVERRHNTLLKSYAKGA